MHTSPRNHVATESSPIASDLRSFEIDYDDVSECTESLVDTHHKKGLTARGNEISPSKMPLMRIRSVEIVFEDEMSACTDTALLDRSIEFIISDSDDSTKCVDDLEHLQVEGNEDTVTLNAEGDLSDDNSVSLTKDNTSEEVAETKTSHPSRDADDSTHAPSDSVTIEDISINVSEVIDSGRFTEDASSSHLETVPILAYEDALLSQSFDVITVDNTAMTTFEISDESSFSKHAEARLYEYIDSDSDSSDNTAVCDADAAIQHLTSFHETITPEEHTLCDSSDLQYDSFIDMGKF